MGTIRKVPTKTYPKWMINDDYKQSHRIHIVNKLWGLRPFWNNFESHAHESYVTLLRTSKTIKNRKLKASYTAKYNLATIQPQQSFQVEPPLVIFVLYVVARSYFHSVHSSAPYTLGGTNRIIQILLFSCIPPNHIQYFFIQC